MNIIIVGCGKVGSTIATHLYEEKHNITVIDTNAEVVNELLNTVDCMGIVGNGAVISGLKDAGIDKADVLVAVTQSDEVNMICCMMARKISGCKTIARVRNPEYNDEISYIRNELNISTTINPEYSTANEIARILQYSSALSADTFFKGRLSLLKVQVNESSPLCDLKLMDVPLKLKCNVLICMIERGEEVIIPSGMDEIKNGDKLSFVADNANAYKFFKQAGLTLRPIKNIMIVGGGRIAYYLVQILKSSNVNIKVIEQDRQHCEELSEMVDNVSIVCANASDKKLLLQEGLNEMDAFISLTGLDEENVILSLFVSKSTHAKVLTKVNRINFEDTLKDLDIGTIINPKTVTANMILMYVRSLVNVKGSKIERLYKLAGGNVEALEFNVTEDSEITNKPLKEMKFKPNVLVAGIFRKNKVVISNGNEMIMRGDRVVIITKDNQFNELVDILA